MAQTIKDLINLLTMLHLRDSVSIEDITEKFHISERTAFRHIERLSQAGVPVYYDRQRKGYRLLRNLLVRMSDLNLNEAILLLSGLRLLSDSTNDKYRTAIESLVTKISAAQDFYFEEVWQSVAAQNAIKSDGKKTIEETSKALTNLILQMAIRYNKQAFLKIREEEKEAELRVRDISLYFDDEMLVKAKRGTSSKEIELSSILFAQLL